MRTRTTTIAFLAILVLGSAGMAAHAQGYPTRPVRIVEPFGVGGGPDLLTRALAPELSKLWGQPVTVENVPGAGATAGPALVAKSPADGYTLLINTSAQAYSAALLQNLPYDPLKDFIPLAPHYHASSDTFDKVDLHELKTNTAVAAVFTLGLANSEQRPGSRYSRSEVVALVKATALDPRPFSRRRIITYENAKQPAAARTFD
jgi:hypothetical protein